jgi:hypothetical protein
MILETIEPFVEVINLVLAIVIVLTGILIGMRLEGKLKKAWNYFILAMLLFGVHEVIGSLAEFGVFEIEGLYAFTEFLFISFFFISVIVFKKLFESIKK